MDNPKKKTKKADTLVFSLKTSLYLKEVIVGACYVFIDRVYIHLDSKKKGEIIVEMSPKDNVDKKELEKIKGEFENELLVYAHRVNITKNTGKIRELIVERALYSSIDDSDEESEAFDDPLGIAVPWEEKYGNK